MNLKHHFLLPIPSVHGNYFADSLTYICEHNDDGAMGIMVNRPSSVSLLELLAQVGLATNRALIDTPVLEGGPVATERGFVLHTDDAQFDSSAELGHDLFLTTALEALDAIATQRAPSHYIVALGYAGWDPGQLEAEILNNVWLTTPADAQVMFETPYDQRLDQAARNMGFDVRLIAKPGNA